MIAPGAAPIPKNPDPMAAPAAAPANVDPICGAEEPARFMA